jgi:hypothetical protein
MNGAAMKRIEHTLFEESATPTFWASIFASAGRERSRKKIRQRAEDFINETGPQNIVSIVEHTPTFGPFSLMVWWYREVPDADTPVIRASAQNQNV